MSSNTVEPTNQIVIDVYDGFFTVKTISDMTIEEMYTILVGCLQHLENVVDGTLDSSDSLMVH